MFTEKGKEILIDGAIILGGALLFNGTGLALGILIVIIRRSKRK